MAIDSKRIRKSEQSRRSRKSARALLECLEERVMLSANPVGSVDAFAAFVISGWAHDADSPSTSLTVRITVDGVATDITANNSRPDLVPLFGSGNFGFSYDPNLGPGTHTVTVAAIDPQSNVLVTLRSGTIVNNAPIGSVGVISSTRIAGWAFDKDAGASPINVRIDVNGTTVQTISASNSRADLTPVVGSPGHGFDVSGSFSGVVDVWAIDAPSGKATLLRSTNHASIGSVDVLTKNQVVGWVFDPDNPTAAKTVRVLVDGAVAAEVTANQARPDIVGITGGSANHGFTANLSLLPGTHTIQVYVLESDTTSIAATLLGQTAGATNASPIGSLDVATRTLAAGWAFDADAGPSPVTVQVKVDGTVVGTGTANLARPDLVAATGSAAHAFSISYPQLTAGPHTVELDALDVPSGAAIKIRSEVIDNTKPIGSFGVANPATLAGWAIDSDTPGTPAQVIIVLDGTAYPAVAADGNRPDLVPVIGSAAHGFSLPTPTNLFGTHTVSAYAMDTFDNSLTLLGTRTFVNRPPTGSIDVLTNAGVSGWVYDPDDPTKSLTVLVRIDGTIVSQITASNTRDGLTPVIGSPNHGFSTSYSLIPGSHKVEIFAADPATGVTALIGTKTVLK